jgi:hypothetical protein
MFLYEPKHVAVTDVTRVLGTVYLITMYYVGLIVNV